MRRIGRPAPQSGVKVGDVCTKGGFTISVDLSVGEALAKVRTSGKRGDIFYIYVVDTEQRLKGIVSIRNLLLGQDEDPISAVYSPKVEYLRSADPLEKAYQAFSQARFLSLPVVDGEGRIQGVLHAHELLGENERQIDALFEERTRGELFELLGIKAETLAQGAVPTAMNRLPWLLINIVGGTFSAICIHLLGGKLTHAVAILAFVPILLIVSESIGMQTASLVIANLHRSAGKSRHREVLFKEFFVAFILGLCCSILVGGGVALWRQSLDIALPVGLTVLLGAVGVSALGNLIPYLIHRLKIDPRVAAGPVVLAIADSATLLLYLFLAVVLTR